VTADRMTPLDTERETLCECGRPAGECIKGDMDYCDAKTDPPFICPEMMQPCLTEHDEHCEDYGCARKAGISITDEWS
jgi:hypothetical protein